MAPAQAKLTIPKSVHLMDVLGPADSLAKRVEDLSNTTITARGTQITLYGETAGLDLAMSMLAMLISKAERGEVATEEDIDALVRNRKAAEEGGIGIDDVILTYGGKAIRPKTEGQRRYVNAIRKHTMTFATGPAGTGKTYLAMAMAVAALKRHEVGRIILTRPVVEAGESLGYLPGTLQEKLDPYIRPLYDALFDMTDMEKGNQLIEQGIIVIAPLAFMRGRTLNDAFVILDEAQNTTPDQMKMFLTRLGFGSKFVITGDGSQRDLHGESGLQSARRVLRGIDDISFCELGRDDVIRHTLVGLIVDAYDRDGQARRKSRGQQQDEEKSDSQE